VRAIVAAVVAGLAVACPLVAHADEPASLIVEAAEPADVADHMRLTGFVVGELAFDIGFARAPRLYVWDPLSRERALPIANLGLASGLVVLQFDW
jgi:hypothetical protein